ncbi:MAG: Maf family protein [Pseudomonadota bacterium]|jgi:septum formation protein
MSQTPPSEAGLAGRLVLASASPRRLALLAQIGVVPSLVEPAAVDETPHAREAPVDHARRLAREKAELIAGRHQGAVVLGADTVVAVGRRILGKPTTEAEAARCLHLMSGRRHRVYSALMVIDAQGRRRARLVTTIVAFKRLEAREIDAYIATGEWRDKAGGYAIQGRAAGFVRWLNGSPSSVVGLPLYETRALLRAAGLDVP